MEAMLESLREQEEALDRAKGYLEEAAEELEEYFPTVSEEISWITENVAMELIATRTKENYLADGVDPRDL